MDLEWPKRHPKRESVPGSENQEVRGWCCWAGIGVNRLLVAPCRIWGIECIGSIKSENETLTRRHHEGSVGYWAARIPPPPAPKILRKTNDGNDKLKAKKKHPRNSCSILSKSTEHRHQIDSRRIHSGWLRELVWCRVGGRSWTPPRSAEPKNQFWDRRWALHGCILGPLGTQHGSPNEFLEYRSVLFAPEVLPKRGFGSKA